MVRPGWELQLYRQQRALFSHHRSVFLTLLCLCAPTSGCSHAGWRELGWGGGGWNLVVPPPSLIHGSCPGSSKRPHVLSFCSGGHLPQPLPGGETWFYSGWSQHFVSATPKQGNWGREIFWSLLMLSPPPKGACGQQWLFLLL